MELKICFSPQAENFTTATKIEIRIKALQIRLNAIREIRLSVEDKGIQPYFITP
jgi:hypothetical protein